MRPVAYSGNPITISRTVDQPLSQLTNQRNEAMKVMEMTK